MARCYIALLALGARVRPFARVRTLVDLEVGHPGVPLVADRTHARLLARVGLPAPSTSQYVFANLSVLGTGHKKKGDKKFRGFRTPEFRMVEVHAGLVEAEGTYDSSGPSERQFWSTESVEESVVTVFSTINRDAPNRHAPVPSEV
jgi:hypothetical protein